MSCVPLFAIPRTVACQAPLSMGFSKQEDWSGLPVPSSGDLPNPGLLHGRQISYHLSHQGSPQAYSLLIFHSFNIQLLIECFLYGH